MPYSASSAPDGSPSPGADVTHIHTVTGRARELNNLIPAGSPYQLNYATAINNNGQIAINAYDTATSQTHALLLTPS